MFGVGAAAAGEVDVTRLSRGPVSAGVIQHRIEVERTKPTADEDGGKDDGIEATGQGPDHAKSLGQTPRFVYRKRIMYLARAASPTRAAALLLGLLAGLPLVGAAQAASALATGARVRVKAIGSPGAWVQGELVRLTSDSVSILVADNADAVHLPRSSLAQVQVSQGIHARTGHGALLGLGIGAGIGLGIGLTAAATRCTTAFCEIHVGPDDVLALTAIFGGAGAGIGALIGAVSHGERWQRVDWPRVAARLRPALHGRMLGITLRF
jgi:hypothetical protein